MGYSDNRKNISVHTQAIAIHLKRLWEAHIKATQKKTTRKKRSFKSLSISSSKKSNVFS